MGRPRRVRQHVNPLARGYQVPRAVPLQVPASGTRGGVEVELGCADAHFSFELARARPDLLVVGIDIRERMVARNRERAAEERLANLVFGYANLAIDLDRVFAPGSVDRFHLLFPDPWFKARHRKRRVVSESLLSVVSRQLRDGGELHFATDVFEVALEAMAEIDGVVGESLGFANLSGPWRFAADGPLPFRSRRERTTLARGARVWRMRYGVRASEAEARRAGASGNGVQRR